MTKIKICGLTRHVDIEIVNEFLPDYIGFVFANSRRRVTSKEAKVLKNELDKRIQAVGVFVNEPMEQVISLCHEKIIEVVQLHGDEKEEYIIELKKQIEQPIIKAIRVKSKEHVIKEGVSSCDYFLLDTYSKNQYGGSGERFSWDLIPELIQPYFVAGGLELSNISQCIHIAKPYGVDISSGVETNGYKDKEKIGDIISRIRSIDNQLNNKKGELHEERKI